MAGNIDIRTKVGLRIKELRLESGMSQEDFANHIDMARSYFAEVETGKRNVSIANLEKIVDGLGVTMEEFFASQVFSSGKPKAGKGGRRRRPAGGSQARFPPAPCQACIGNATRPPLSKTARPFWLAALLAGVRPA